MGGAGSGGGAGATVAGAAVPGAAMPAAGAVPENRRIYHPVTVRFPGDRPRLEAELALAERAVVDSPDDLAALEAKANVLFALDREAEARVVWDWMLKLDPLHRRTLVAKGLSLMERRAYREAVVLFDEALFLEPIDGDLLLDKGMALMFLGEYQAAARVFEEMVEIDPEDGDGLYLSACAYALTGRPVKAVRALGGAIALEASLVGEAERNPDFDGLRGRGDFRRLLEDGGAA